MAQTLTVSVGWRESLSTALEHPLHRLRLGYAAWLFGVFCYFLPAATWNPVSRFDLTRSIVERHSLNIDAYVDNTGDRARRDEHWYTDKAPLASFLALPAYQALHWLDRARGRGPSYEVVKGTPDRPAQRVTVNRSFQRSLYVCSLATAGLSGVAIGLALFELLRRRMPTPGALAGSALAVLATPIFPYATSFYGHAVAGAFLTVALALLDRGGRGRVFAAGACLGASIGSEYLGAVPAAALVVVFGVASLLGGADVPPRVRARQLWHEFVVPLALGALGPVLLLAAYHWLCFGAPWRTGYSFVVDPKFAAGHASGFLGVRLPQAQALWGLSFGRLRGLFYVAPLALALSVGLVARAGGERAAGASPARDVAALAGALAAAALFLVNASYYMWWGGAASAPRHLVPVLGFLALGIPWLWRHRAGRAACMVLGLLSLANMVGIAAVGLEAPEKGDVLFDFVYQRLLQGRLSALSGASNLGMEFGLVRGGTLGPLLAWLLLGAHVLRRQVGELERPSGTLAAASVQV